MVRLFVHNLRFARFVAACWGVAALFVASFSGAQAQTSPERVEFWTIGFVRKPLNNELLLQFDAQFRRQSAPRAADLMQFPALWSLRSWIWYKFDEHWQAIAQPFGYFQHTALSLVPASPSATGEEIAQRRFDEARFALGAAYSARFEETGASLRLWALTESRFFQPFTNASVSALAFKRSFVRRCPLRRPSPFRLLTKFL